LNVLGQMGRLLLAVSLEGLNVLQELPILLLETAQVRRRS
jgi:hypothetical protein